jgi:hypothetical protein
MEPVHAHPGTLWTIGHSTRPWEVFVDMLREAGITQLVDVRRFAGSRRNPQFSPLAMAPALAQAGVDYIPMARARRSPAAATGFTERGVARRCIPGICGLHGDAGIRNRARTPDAAGRRRTDGSDVRRSRLVAMPSAPHRRRFRPRAAGRCCT